MPATTADPKTQAQGFVLRVDKPPFTLRPGMALTAWMELPDGKILITIILTALATKYLGGSK